jgi:hypothetical protein
MSPVSADAPTTEQVSSRSRFRKLASKPLSNALSFPSRAQQPHLARIPNRQIQGTPRGCPLCRRVGCQVRSHKAFVAQSRTASTSTSTSKSKQSDDIYTKSYAYFYAQEYVDADLAAGKVDPFHKLPIRQETPELHMLFHDCKHNSYVCRCVKDGLHSLPRLARLCLRVLFYVA